MQSVCIGKKSPKTNFPFKKSSSLQLIQSLRSLILRPSREHGSVTGGDLTLRAICDAAGCVLATGLSAWSCGCNNETRGLSMAPRTCGWARQRRIFAQTREGHVPQPAQALSPEKFWNVVSLILEQTCPAQLVFFCGFSVHPLQACCQDGPRVVARETDLRTPGQCHVLLSWCLLLFNFCWTYIKNWVNPVFWWRLTLPGTVTLELDGAVPVRCCIANGCGSFVKCLLISEGPWTH